MAHRPVPQRGGRWLRFSHRDSRAETGLLMLLALAFLASALLGGWLLQAILPALVRPLLIVVFMLLLWMIPAALCRRLHDRDRRGAWLLLPVLTGSGGLALSHRLGPRPGPLSPGPIALLIGSDVLLLATLAALIWLLLHLLRPGTVGLNRFGPPPRSLDHKDISA